MTLGEWLNHMIVEGEAPESEIEVPDPSIIPHPRVDAPARLEAVHHPADEVGKVTDAIERLTSRIEAAEQRSTLAITGIDQSVRGALSRLEGAEREQVSVAARFEGAVDEIRTEQARALERLRRIEAESTGPRSAEALRALEGSVGKLASQTYDTEARSREAIAALEAKVAALEAGAPAPDTAALADEVAARVLGRLEAAETQTNEAIRDLGYSFVKLDGRLRKVEGADNTAALQTLSHGLNARLEQVRQEMAESLRRASDGGFGRVEQKLSEMTAHVHAAEQRSAMAIERMGREMVNMADNLSRRVQTVEGRSAQAVEHVGGEVSRIAGLVEQRLAHTDGSSAQALERLGVEIARITERLSERIANSERRSAQAIDDVGEQVARVTERISQRQERTSTDLSERIRQSEERTARLLEEAREKIDASMTSATRRIADSVAAAPPAPAAPVRRAEPAGMDPFAPDPFQTRGQAIPEDAFAPRAFESQSFGGFPAGPAEPGFGDDFPARDSAPAAFSDADFDAADEFVALDDPAEGLDFETAPVPAFDAEPGRPLSTREVIEQARAAARSAGGSTSEPKAAKPARKGLFGSRTKAPKKQAGSTLTTALAITGVLAFGGAAATGYVLYSGGSQGTMGDRIARGLQIKEADAQEILTAEADTTPPLTTGPRVAMAIAPDLADPAAAATPATPAPAAAAPVTAAALFNEAVRRVEARQPGGLNDLRKSANQGYAPAQFYLAKLYENGEGGVSKDPAEARRWTERAAQGGDRKAMHNLGLYYFEGTGGSVNQTTAAQWFQRAADLGLTDSQYNLGKLYEIGSGVKQNGAEAYKWYLIASRSGDAEAKASAARLRAELAPAARASAERAAGGYRAATPNASTRLAAAPAVGSAAQAQRALSRLGYYQGPQDGRASPALEGALKAYQKDKGLPVTGQMDAQSSASLAIYAQ
ncbi:MAG: peptidoglycan-binding protein [Caulobacter sp.]|nr:peptidoglycan-binding protein [Caulobacter sp.]